MKLNTYRQKHLDEDIYFVVKQTAESLFSFLESPKACEALSDANLPGNSSSIVQNVFVSKAEELGFKSERRGLFQNIPTNNLRPDYYKPIKDTGIIIEVERGKTIMNNMDMLDMWKCHLCNKANHLFLFVPNKLRHNPNTTPYDCFAKVSNRLSPFFNAENYCNVHSLWIFGY